MKIVGLADGRPTTVDGQYLVECDVDDRDGRGSVFATDDKAKAKRFDGIGHALDYWRRTSHVVPLRPDGEPNRPLTAYTIELENDRDRVRIVKEDQ